MMQAPAESYRHTQIGHLMLIVGSVLMVGGLCGLFIVIIGGLILLGVGLVLVVLFGCLAVVICDRSLQVRFGAGLIHKRYDLGQFADVRVVRNRWYYGWGIRWGPGVFLYNVSGLDAVELKRPDGTRVRIGTDQPEALAQALREAMHR